MYWVTRKSCLKLFYESISDKKKTKYEASTASYPWWRLFLRPVHTRELAPETRSRNTLPGKYPNQYTRRTRRGSLLPQYAPATRSGSKARSSAPTISSEKVCCATKHLVPSFAHHFTASKFQYTHEGTCSWNRLGQQISPWSLLPHIKLVWYEGAKLGSKSFVAQHNFSPEIVCADEGALLPERVAGVCCGSKLPRVYRPLNFEFTSCKKLRDVYILSYMMQTKNINKLSRVRSTDWKSALKRPYICQY